MVEDLKVEMEDTHFECLKILPDPHPGNNLRVERDVSSETPSASPARCFACFPKVSDGV